MLKMASVAVLQRLQSRAAQADQLIAQLKQQLTVLKTNAAVSVCLVEEEKLAKENANLKQEVQALKGKLVKLEKRNGIKQYALPNGKPAAAVASITPPPEPVPTSATVPAQTEPAKDKPAKTAKKEKKQKNANGADKKAAAGDAEAAPIDVSRLDMRIGFITSAKRHPDADTLYVEEVDLGEERGPRTIVSGLVKHIPIEQMQQRFAIFCVNLKPAKMRGILSEGMIMCGSTPEKVEIIEPPAGVVKGDRIAVDDYLGSPDALLNPKKKIWEQVQPDLMIDSQGLATYKGKLWKVEDKGTCCVPSLKNVIIK